MTAPQVKSLDRRYAARTVPDGPGATSQSAVDAGTSS